MHFDGSSGAVGSALKLHQALLADYRHSLSRELHRTVCQQLTAAKLELDLHVLESGESEALNRARATLGTALKEIRELLEALGHEQA